MKFKVGDIVKIRNDSEFAGQNSHVGTIVTTDIYDWFVVKFTDGYRNSYRNYDLEKYEKPKKKVYGIVNWCERYYK